MRISRIRDGVLSAKVSRLRIHISHMMYLIPFIEVYIALTAPECTDSQSLLREETQTNSSGYNFNQKWYYAILIIATT